MADDDKPVTGPAGGTDDPAEGLAPPPREKGLRNNPAMLGVLALVVLAVVVFVVALALG
jgi:hypothetical protein